MHTRMRTASPAQHHVACCQPLGARVCTCKHRVCVCVCVCVHAQGHPLCKFGRKRFYDSNELYRHMESGHEHCFICRRDNPSQYTYFRHYEELEGMYSYIHLTIHNSYSHDFTVQPPPSARSRCSAENGTVRPCWPFYVCIYECVPTREHSGECVPLCVCVCVCVCAEHFTNAHHPCPHPSCREKKFVVFAQEHELKRHFANEHGDELKMSRAQRREALAIPINVQYRGGEAAAGESCDTHTQTHTHTQRHTRGRPLSYAACV